MTVRDASSLWTNSFLTVGQAGSGAIALTNGGGLSSVFDYIASNPNSTGTVTIDGTGSSWIDSTANIGYGGNGSLAITHGGLANFNSSNLGYNAGSTGMVTVDGLGSRWTGVSVNVGYSGNGSLSISNGANAKSSAFTETGYNSGSSGTIKIDGAGSLWSDNGNNIGYSGNGTLTIVNGGKANSTFSVNVGYNTASNGVATVDGTGSLWTSSFSFNVGGNGNGSLSISNGGTVTNTSYSRIGENSGSSGSAAVIGPASAWNNNDLDVGGSGIGNLSITNGGRVNCTGVFAISDIGNNQGSTGIATVDGATSTWSTTYQFFVGNSGNGTLNVTNGSSVTVGKALYVAYANTANGVINFGSTGGTIATGSLYASPSQTTGNGTINTNGLVSDIDLLFDATHGLNQSLAWNSGGQNVVVNLDISGATQPVGDLGAGYQGNGSLTIRDGVSVTAANATLGFKAGSYGIATVTGTGSTFNVGYLTIGRLGGAIFNISNGGSVVASSSVGVGSNSSLSVDGAASNLTAGTLSGSGLFTISNGAQIAATTASISGSMSFGPNGGTLTTRTLDYSSPSQFTGTGVINASGEVPDGAIVFDATHGPVQTLLWNGPNQNVTVNLDLSGASRPAGDLGAGYLGNGSLTIEGGANITSANGYLGYGASSNGTATISGAGSTWTNTNMFVGQSGSGTLSIVQGGVVNTTSSGSIGSNSIATVSGAGSTWNNRDLSIGGRGTCLLEVLNGGLSNSSQLIIGQFQGPGAALIDGAGSALTTNSLYVGQGGNGSLSITRGATVTDTNSYLESGNAIVTVDGTSSAWINQALDAGYTGPGTTIIINISNGGRVTAATVALTSPSLLSIDVGDGSVFDIHAGTFSDFGTLRMKAVPGLAAGSYTPVVAGSWASVTPQTLGGSWRRANHTFVVTAAAVGNSGQPTTINLSQKQRIAVTDVPSGHKLEANFQSTTSTSNLTLTSTPLTTSQASLLQSDLAPGNSILDGWTFTTTGYTTGTPIFLSLSVGQNFATSALAVWQYNGSTWTPFAASDLAYDGTYADFTASALSGFAIVTTHPLLGDANADGLVDLNDLNTVLNHLGQTSPNRADGNFDGAATIDLNDLNDVLNNLGVSFAGSSSVLAAEALLQTATPAPEPASLSILAAATLFVTRSRRRK